MEPRGCKPWELEPGQQARGRGQTQAGWGQKPPHLGQEGPVCPTSLPCEAQNRGADYKTMIKQVCKHGLVNQQPPSVQLLLCPRRRDGFSGMQFDSGFLSWRTIVSPHDPSFLVFFLLENKIG